MGKLGLFSCSLDALDPPKTRFGAVFLRATRRETARAACIDSLLRPRARSILLRDRCGERSARGLHRCGSFSFSLGERNSDRARRARICKLEAFRADNKARATPAAAFKRCPRRSAPRARRPRTCARAAAASASSSRTTASRCMPSRSGPGLLTNRWSRSVVRIELLCMLLSSAILV